jgi:hypothetical protein
VILFEDIEPLRELRGAEAVLAFVDERGVMLEVSIPDARLVV